MFFKRNTNLEPVEFLLAFNCALLAATVIPPNDKTGNSLRKPSPVLVTFLNASGNPVGDSVIVDFNPDTNSDVAWQYAAAALTVPGDYTSIKIELAYDYNVNTVDFDGVQLYKEKFGNSYTYDGNGNVETVSAYTHDENNNMLSVTLLDGTVTTYTYDGYRNVKTATTHTGVGYILDYDTRGNDTKVSIGSNAISSSADYSDNGNILESTTDAMGNVTLYGYDVLFDKQDR